MQVNPALQDYLEFLEMMWVRNVLYFIYLVFAALVRSACNPQAFKGAELQSVILPPYRFAY